MLDLYLNIKQKRIENHWSQQELADRIGYSDKSMIAKIESGKVDLSQSKIAQFASVFSCSVSELMGWIDTPNEERLPVPEYDPDMQEWAVLLPRLSPDQKASLLQTARLFAQNNKDL